MALRDTRSVEKKEDFTADQVTEVNTTSTSQDQAQGGDEHSSLWQNVKKYRNVTYITLAMTSAILLYGYDTVVVGTISAMPVFQ